MDTGRSLGLAMLGGIAHAGVVLGVALRLGYAVGPAAHPPVGLAWRYGGLLLLGALPVYLAARYRLLLPLAILVLTTGSVLGLELTPPGPTFQDAAALERLPERTGLTVVTDGGYVVAYVADAAVWAVGLLLAGLAEHGLRSSWDRLPASPLARTLPIPAQRRPAVIAAWAVGLGHAAVMTWFAVRLGVRSDGGPEWLLYPFSVLGMWLLAAVPVYLLARRRLLLPTGGLAALVLLDARANLAPSVDDAHALYFGGWWLVLLLLLAVAGVEYGVRRVRTR